MQNADLVVISQLRRWIENGERCWLCTVVETWGSSPRPVGSLLCCNAEGVIAGSLSGGCVEDDLLEKLTAGQLAQSAPALLVYGVTREETERLGLPCGGQLNVVVEPFTDQRHLHVIRSIDDHLRDRQCIERKVDIASGDMTATPSARFQPLHFGGDFEDTSHRRHTLTQTYGPRYQLLLVGAGQIAGYLAEMAMALDYQVIVCDPRDKVLQQWSIKGVQLTSLMPDDAVRQLADDRYTAVVTLTHDPRIDDMCLMEALRRDLFFVGALGSRRTSAKRRERLLLLDLSEARIDALHAPVGLPIGSKTPAEIALAILAQLTALRSAHMQSNAADGHDSAAAASELRAGR